MKRLKMAFRYGLSTVTSNLYMFLVAVFQLTIALVFTSMLVAYYQDVNGAIRCCEQFINSNGVYVQHNPLASTQMSSQQKPVEVLTAMGITSDRYTVEDSVILQNVTTINPAVNDVIAITDVPLL